MWSHVGSKKISQVGVVFEWWPSELLVHRSQNRARSRDGYVGCKGCTFGAKSDQLARTVDISAFISEGWSLILYFYLATAAWRALQIAPLCRSLRNNRTWRWHCLLKFWAANFMCKKGGFGILKRKQKELLAADERVTTSLVKDEAKASQEVDARSFYT